MPVTDGWTTARVMADTRQVSGGVTGSPRRTLHSGRGVDLEEIVLPICKCVERPRSIAFPAF